MPDFRYLGLPALVRPIYFTELTNLFLNLCAEKFELSFEVDTASLQNAAVYYQTRAPLLLHPTVLNVLETYAHSILENLIIRASARNSSGKLDPEDYTAHFCDHPAECLAVFSAAFLFAHEAGVDMERCGFKHATLLGVVRLIQQDRSRTLFDAPAFSACRDVAGARQRISKI